MHRTDRLIRVITLLALAVLRTLPEDPSPWPQSVPEALETRAQAIGRSAAAIQVDPDAAGVAPFADADLELAVSMSPSVELVNASSVQSDRLFEAVTKFTELGLGLPDLEVQFFADVEACDGHMGLFESPYRPWRISICSSADFVYEHELAHAWELANATDSDRADFMSFLGLERWNDPGDEWSARGVEIAAFIIQQGLLDASIWSSSAELQTRLEAFELLTGIASPRANPGVHT